MSQSTAVARIEEPVGEMTPPVNLCQRIVARCYSTHQQVQESINRDWADLLLG